MLQHLGNKLIYQYLHHQLYNADTQSLIASMQPPNIPLRNVISKSNVYNAFLLQIRQNYNNYQESTKVIIYIYLSYIYSYARYKYALRIMINNKTIIIKTNKTNFGQIQPTIMSQTAFLSFIVYYLLLTWYHPYRRTLYREFQLITFIYLFIENQQLYFLINKTNQMLFIRYFNLLLLFIYQLKINNYIFFIENQQLYFLINKTNQMLFIRYFNLLLLFIYQLKINNYIFFIENQQLYFLINKTKQKLFIRQQKQQITYTLYISLQNKQVLRSFQNYAKMKNQLYIPKYINTLQQWVFTAQYTNYNKIYFFSKYQKSKILLICVQRIQHHETQLLLIFFFYVHMYVHNED
eukprot:TRINITY_DN6945_c0_g2_i1.p1 TRINITY_DN6945_c0_g2~~TRINITY_DN6945_c0_g2_i1.p1  ORF type:complete len:382 (-),score=-33.30 TRINITY_DN6945_c0_g2_i1:421-1470(-)